MLFTCASQITHVNVHARGALVTRRVTVPPDLPDGDVDLDVPGVTALAEGGSVRAALPGSARAVVAVRTALFVPDAPAVAGRSVERVRALQRRIERLQAERQRLEARAQGLASLALDPRLGATSAARPVVDRTGDALASAALADALAGELDARVLALDEALRALARERDAAALEDAQATSAARTGAGHPTRRVTVRVAGRGAVPALELAYVVPAARWWPVYTLRIADGNRRATWWIEALVAQLTGEDWTGVRLALSTGDLLFDARLPELASLRFGRAQTPRRGYRAPPPGLDRMFAGYDRAFAQPLPPPPPCDAPDPEPMGLLEDVDELLASEAPATTRAGSLRSRAMAMEMGPPPQDAPAPMSAGRLRQSVPPPAAKAKGGFLGGFGGGGAPEARKSESRTLARPSVGGPPGGHGDDGAPAPEPPAEIEPADAWLDFDSLRVQPAGDAGRRGRLARESTAVEATARGGAEAKVEGIAPASGVRDPRSSRGVFDHRYDADGLADVGSDGQAHRVMLGTAETVPTIRWRAVPREAAEVYREAELRNPFDAPLLAGPVDVYVDGSLLAVAAIEGIDRGGTLHVGMGVEERLRVARNVRAEEQTAGILGGDTEVRHDVSIELASALASSALVEVVDRVPVADEKHVEVTMLASRPEAEVYKQTERGAPVRGGLLWKAIVPAGGRLVLEYSYRIALPSKNEIVGGNRRD